MNLMQNLTTVRGSLRKLTFAGVPVLSRSFIKWVVNFARGLRIRFTKFSDLETLMESHYKTWSEKNHPSRRGLEIALNATEKPKVIVETGTSAWGCDSSRLLDAFARFTHAKFITIDIRQEASKWLRFQVSKHTQFEVDDSVHFLKEVYPLRINRTIDLAYLDSFDLDLNNPLPSELHCLEEFRAILKFSRVGTVIVIDDTRSVVEEFPPENRQVVQSYIQKTGRVPGKGSLVHQKIVGKSDFEILWHSENLVIKIQGENCLNSI